MGILRFHKGLVANMKIWKMAVEIPKECTGGDCYEVSGRYVMDRHFMGLSNPVLVHGTVTGQGKIHGIEYDHAWVEEGDEALDMSCGRNIRMPKVVYYALGQIKDTKTYTYEQMREMVNKYKHWGPWE